MKHNERNGATAAGYPSRSRRLIGATLFVVGTEVALSFLVYGWDMSSGLGSPGEWESDEWLALFASIWIVPMVVLLWRTFAAFRATGRQMEALRGELELLHRVEAEHEERLRAQREAIQTVIADGAVNLHFQPIVRLGDEAEVVGFEALARFPTGSAQSWFAAADEAGLTRELELEALSQALRLADRLPHDAYLSLNASPATIDEREFFALFRDIEAERIVIEITETLVVDDYERMNRILRSLRRLGARLAVDDAGAGFASLQHIVNLSPDIIKLDRSLVHRIDTQPARRAMARAIAAFADEVGATIVAEGVEEAREMVILRDLGVACAQGYLFGKPAPLGEPDVVVTPKNA